MNEIEYIIQYMSEEIHVILKIDLLEDTFEVIKVFDEELNKAQGSSNHFSEWLTNFADKGQVHTEDLKRFKENTDLEYMKNYFLSGKKKLAISYRRIFKYNYKWVSIRIIPAPDYSPENQKLMLFVQDDDSAESLDLIQTAKLQFAIMNSLANTYVTMHVIDLETDSVYDLSRHEGNSLTFDKMEHATEMMHTIMNMRVTDNYLQDALEFSELTTIQDRMKGKKSLSRDFVGKNIGWFRAQFVTIDVDQDQRPKHVIFATSAVDEEKKREEKLFQISTELNLATLIQSNSIPNNFPAFPHRKEFDLYATMEPAKEVGGDFYDFFQIDKEHIAFVMADVSGKGIPAALFMMVSKVLLKNQSLIESSPAKILQSVNHQLCENNKAEMFVTVWLGILNTETGVLTAANAGHEFPALKKANGDFELYKDNHGFVLAGMDDMRYKDYQIYMEKGDVLFVYTDGVAEATDANGTLFGTDRMLAALNTEKDINCEGLITNVRQKIEEFVLDAPQFDDITMLAMKYLGPEEQ